MPSGDRTQLVDRKATAGFSVSISDRTAYEAKGRALRIIEQMLEGTQKIVTGSKGASRPTTVLLYEAVRAACKRGSFPMNRQKALKICPATSKLRARLKASTSRQLLQELYQLLQEDSVCVPSEDGKRIRAREVCLELYRRQTYRMEDFLLDAC